MLTARPAPLPDTPRARRSRPRAAPALGSLVDTRRWSSVPGRASARERRRSALRPIQPKTSTAAPTAPNAPTKRAAVRCRFGASSAAAPATALATSSGPTRCEPQRSCSFVATSPVSYVPIETCSAPWYDVSSSPRSATSAGDERRDHRDSLAREHGERRAADETGARRGGDQRDRDRRALERHAGRRVGHA